MGSETRDTRFDNIKGLLIVLVVLGHTFGHFQATVSQTSSIIRTIIYSFHMPVFVFVSGYFSRNFVDYEKLSEKCVKRILVPLIVFHLLKWLVSSRSLETLFEPSWTLWFLLCLFYWKLSIGSIIKLRFPLIFSLMLALLVGFTSMGDTLSASRAFTFLPFFLLGYKTTPSSIKRISQSGKAIATLIIMACFSTIIIIEKIGISVVDHFYMNSSYAAFTELSIWGGVMLRVYSLIVGFVGIYCMIAIVPGRECVFTKIGNNTMPIYIFHSFAISVLQYFIQRICLALFVNDIVSLVFSIIFSFIFCYVFSSDLVVKSYNKLLEMICFVFMK